MFHLLLFNLKGLWGFFRILQMLLVKIQSRGIASKRHFCCSFCSYVKFCVRIISISFRCMLQVVDTYLEPQLRHQKRWLIEEQDGSPHSLMASITCIYVGKRLMNVVYYHLISSMIRSLRGATVNKLMTGWTRWFQPLIGLDNMFIGWVGGLSSKVVS